MRIMQAVSPRLAMLAVLLLLWTSAAAQQYASRPIRIIIQTSASTS